MANLALCVGINDYPGTNMDLAGCVNDAQEWRGVLERRGYKVDTLIDREATRARIVEALRSAIGQATGSDSVVFTFSGHGSWLPDDDRDEPDARDEMMCPYDVMKEQYLLDDELHDIFGCICRSLLRHRADRDGTVLEQHHGRCDAFTLAVGHDFRPGRSDNGNRRIGCAQVDADGAAQLDTPSDRIAV